MRAVARLRNLMPIWRSCVVVHVLVTPSQRNLSGFLSASKSGSWIRVALGLVSVTFIHFFYNRLYSLESIKYQCYLFK